MVVPLQEGFFRGTSEMIEAEDFTTPFLGVSPADGCGQLPEARQFQRGAQSLRGAYESRPRGLFEQMSRVSSGMGRRDACLAVPVAAP